MKDLKRCYEILEIGPDSTYEEARTAFRDMVSIWHPDKFIHNARLKEKAEEKIKLINAAWEELQAYFLQNRANAGALTGKELAVPVTTSNSRECRQRHRDGKTSGAGCYITDLDFEPLVDVEQARKAYHHRFQHCGSDPGTAPRGGDCDPGDEAGCMLDAGGMDECAQGGEGTSGPPGHGSEGEARETLDVAGDRSRVEKAAVRGHKAAHHFPDDLFNESGRKIKLLTDSYWLGFLERKFVNWQQREREHKKQRDADKEIARKNKILADRYLSGYKTWLAMEKAKRGSSPIIGSLFKRNASPAVKGSTGKFLFGVPDISLTFVKGGSFLAGNDPRGSVAMPHGGHHYRVVMVSDYYIGRYPVTVRQWSKAMGVETGGGEGDLPVLLTWEGAHEFISRLNEITGLKFRVPTDAEWQYAARCGAHDDLRHGVAKEGAERGHFSSAGRRIKLHKPGAPGHIDMSGNGGEWVTGIPLEKPLRKGQLAARGGAAVSGQSYRGAVQRDAHGNIQVFHALPRNLKVGDKGIRFSFRLAHAAF